MIPVLRKVAQLNIKCGKNGSLITDVCIGAPPDKITPLAWAKISLFNEKKITFFFLQK